MIDLHCHILPEIDDGSGSIDESIALLKLQQKQGIDKLVFTPHFNFGKISIEDFVRARAESFERLSADERFQTIGIETKLGAEVYFSMKLIESDVDPLCFEGTNYILIEFPFNSRPYGIKETMTNLLDRGYSPILAHVERYAFFTADPTKLYDLIMMGCLAQVNASAVIKASGSPNALQYIKWELAHIICSDAHSIKRRPPNTKAAYRYTEKKLGTQYTDWLIENSSNIFNGNSVDLPVIKKPRKFLFRWI